MGTLSLVSTVMIAQKLVIKVWQQISNSCKVWNDRPNNVHVLWKWSIPFSKTKMAHKWPRIIQFLWNDISFQHFDHFSYLTLTFIIILKSLSKFMPPTGLQLVSRLWRCVSFGVTWHEYCFYFQLCYVFTYHIGIRACWIRKLWQ